MKQENNICKDIKNLKDTISRLELMDIYRALYETLSEFILFECTWEIQNGRMCVVHQTTSSKCKRIQIIVFSLCKVELCPGKDEQDL